MPKVSELEVPVRLNLPAVLVAVLLGCDRTAPPPPLVASDFQVRGEQFNLGGPVRAYRFSVEGSRCGSLQAVLYRLSGDTVDRVSWVHFKSLPGRVKGDLWLAEQTGDAFGKPSAVSYSLGHVLGSPSITETHGRFEAIEGPFSQSSQHAFSSGSVLSGREEVLFARCMSRQENHSFGSGSLDQVLQHARQTKDTIVVVTIRWDPN